MAIATTAAIMGGISAASGIVKTIQGAKQKSQAAADLNAYERQDLINPAENLRISTLGANIKREEMARQQSNVMDIVKMGGARSIIGATGKVMASQNRQAQEIANGMDHQMLYREKAIASGEVNRQNMQERREEGDLAGIGQNMMVGNQDMYGGMANIAQAGMFLANNSDFGKGTDGTDGLDGAITEDTRGAEWNNGEMNRSASFNMYDKNNALNGGYNETDLEKYNNIGAYTATT